MSVETAAASFRTTLAEMDSFLLALWLLVLVHGAAVLGLHYDRLLVAAVCGAAVAALYLPVIARAGQGLVGITPAIKRYLLGVVPL